MTTFHATDLGPERSTLTQRAAALAATPVESLQLVEANATRVVFQTLFASGDAMPLKIEACTLPCGTGWLLQWGEATSVSFPRLPLQISGSVISAGDSQMVFDLARAAWAVRRGGATLLETIDWDFLVGNIDAAYGLFRDGEGLGTSLQIHGGERFFGGGEDFGSLVKNGCLYDVVNCDALGTGGQYRYQSTPVFWSTRGFGLAVLDPAPSRLDFGWRRQDLLSITSSRKGLTLLIVPARSAEEFSAALRVGHARGVPEWSFGLWLSRCFYKDQAEVLGVLEGARRSGIEVGVINLDARCWMRAHTRTDFVWDTSRFEPFQEFLPRLRRDGVHVCLWENPYVSSATETLYAEGVRKGFFARAADGSPYPYQWVPPGLKGFPQPPPSGLVDFTNPDARVWWKDLHRPFLRAGVCCFKTDFGEEIPADARFADGRDGWELRNLYSDLYNDCVMEVLTEEHGENGIVWARSGWLRASANPVKWGGDSQSSWRGLRATLRAGLSQAAGGALFWSHDIGGFYGPVPSPELFLRWAQMGLWGSHARCHGTTPREPWEFGEDVLGAFRESLVARNHLRPYFVAEAAWCVQAGQSFLRPLWMTPEADPVTQLIDDTFLAGRDVLVAPFLDAEGGRDVYLPAGGWYDLRTGQVQSGQRWLHCERSRHIPAFARKGSPFELLFRACPRIFSGANPA